MVPDTNVACGCYVPTRTQPVIPPGSANECQRKLGSKQAYHAMHKPRISGLMVFGWCVKLHNTKAVVLNLVMHYVTESLSLV